MYRTFKPSKSWPHTCVVLGTVLLLAACAPEKTDQQYLESARSHFAAGEIDTAIIQVKNALQRNATLPGARGLLGRLHELSGDAESAEKELSRAIATDSAEAELNLPYVRALVQLGRVDDALSVSLDGLSSEDRAAALVAMGLGLMHDERFEESRATLSDALALSPGNVRVLTAVARLSALENDIDAARQRLQQALALEEADPVALELLGDVLWKAGELAEAEAAYFASDKVEPRQLGKVLKLAEVRILQGKWDEAAAILRPVGQVAPRSSVYRYLNGLLQFEQGRVVDAQTEFEAALSVDQNLRPAVYYLAQSHLAQNNPGQTMQYALQYRNLNPEAMDARILLAQAHSLNGDREVAESMLRELLVSGEASEVVVHLLADLMFQKGELDEAMSLFGSLAPMGGGLSAAQSEDESRRGDAEESTKRIDTQHEVVTARTSIASILQLLNNGKTDEALDAASALTHRNPGVAAPLTVSARVHLEAGDTEKAVSSLRDALEIAPGDPLANQLMAGIAMQAGNTPEATQYLQAVLQQHPNHMSTLLSLAEVKASLGETELMLDYLRQAISVDPEALRPRLVMARYQLQEMQYQAALETIGPVVDGQNGSIELMSIQARAMVASRRFAEAKVVLSQLVRAKPLEVRWQLLSAEAHMATGDAERALEALRSVVSLDDVHVTAYAAIARLSLVTGDQSGYQAALDRLARIAPDSPELEVAQALQNWAEPARRKGAPSNTDEVLQQARALWSDNNRSQAIEALKAWLDDNAADLPVWLTLASAHRESGDQDSAVEAYKTALEIDANNAVALNNLAWSLRESAPVDALGYATRALDLSPTSASTMDTVAVLQLNNGLLDKASDTIASALGVEPNNPSIQYHSALIAHASGRPEDAVLTLRGLLDTHAKFPDRAEALRLLSDLDSDLVR